MFYFLVVVVFAASTAAYCPNGCSPPNGECSEAEVCMCAADWVGDDCSVSDVELINHNVVAGSVETRQYRYFHFLTTSQQSSLEFEILQTGAGGDIDVYVRKDKYPDKQSYDQRDISTSREMSFEIPAPDGLYYVGVYGFVRSNFTVVANLKTNCVNDCSGHGNCGSDRVCSCLEDYGGLDCSKKSVLFNPEAHVEPVTVANHQWKYFRIPNDKNTITTTVHVHGSNTVSLYVKFGDFPTLEDFDARQSSTTQDNITISNAQTGMYYLGVYGVSEGRSQFVVVVDSRTECQNKCSGTHGVCGDVTAECTCVEGFSGESCSTMDDSLSLEGVPVEGYVGGNHWNYYHFETYTSNNIAITVNTEGDCYLYLRHESNPTLYTFDYRDLYNQDNKLHHTLQNTAVSTWYVGIYSSKKCTYDVSALLTLQCPNDCTDAEHGSCVQGHCICEEGFVSDDCSVKVLLLENGEPHIDSTHTNAWNYYRFNALPGTRVTVSLKETSTVGNLWMFGSLTGIPTFTLNDSADTETNSNLHRLAVYVDEPQELNFGVYGSILGTGDECEYQIVIWQATF